MLGTIFVQPFVKKKVTPKLLLPLPWDEVKGQNEPSEDTSANSSKAERAKALFEKLRNGE